MAYYYLPIERQEIVKEQLIERSKRFYKAALEEDYSTLEKLYESSLEEWEKEYIMPLSQALAPYALYVLNKHTGFEQCVADGVIWSFPYKLHPFENNLMEKVAYDGNIVTTRGGAIVDKVCCYEDALLYLEEVKQHPNQLKELFQNKSAHPLTIEELELKANEYISYIVSWLPSVKEWFEQHPLGFISID